MEQASVPSLKFLFAVSAVAPVGFSVVVASLPALGHAFSAGTARVFAVMSLFMVVFGAMQLVLGPVSDRLGRRPVLLSGLALFTAASVWCALADTLTNLLLARCAQALGGCVALAVPRAVIHDCYPGVEGTRAMASVAMVQGIVPAVAPLVGGLLVDSAGWRSVFWFCAAYGAIAFAWAGLVLPETRQFKGQGSRPGAPATGAVRQLLRSPTYLGYLLNAALVTVPYVLYLTVVPSLFARGLGLPPHVFGAYNLLLVPCILLGTAAAVRLARRMPVRQLVRWGTMAALASLGLGLALAGELSHWRVLVPLLLYITAHAVVFPLAVGAGIAGSPDRAGAAAGGIGFAQTALGAAAIGVAGWLPLGSAAPFLALSCAAAAASLLPLLIARSVEPAAGCARV